MRIFLIGFMGCGKTYWGQQLGQKLNIPFFDLDEQIVANEGKSINALFMEDGEESFRMKEKEILHILTESHHSFVMACGGGTPCFYNNIDYMKKSGTTVWINSSVENLYQRLVKEKEMRPLIKDLSETQLRSYIIKKFADRRIYYQQASVIVDEEDITLEKLTEQILETEAK